MRPVSQAPIGGTESKHQGPWPECLGLPASDCVHIIKTYAEDLRSSGHVFVIEPDMMVTMDFDEHRVRVWVDESNLVNKIPKRG